MTFGKMSADTIATIENQIYTNLQEHEQYLGKNTNDINAAASYWLIGYNSQISMETKDKAFKPWIQNFLEMLSSEPEISATQSIDKAKTRYDERIRNK